MSPSEKKNGIQNVLSVLKNKLKKPVNKQALNDGLLLLASSLIIYNFPYLKIWFKQ